MAKWYFRRLGLLHCMVPLLAGALVYLFFRPPTLLSSVLHIRYTFPIKNAVAQLLVYSLPDLCWSYSLACALYIVAGLGHLSFKHTAIAIFIFVLFSEGVQLAVPRHFTFDIYDLIAVILAVILATVQMQKLAYEK